MKRESIPVELNYEPIQQRLEELLPEPFSEGFNQLLDEGLIEYDEKGLIVIKNFVKYNQPDNPNIVKGWKVQRDFLPECNLFWVCSLRLRGYCFSRGEKFVEAFDYVFPELANIDENQIDIEIKKFDDQQKESKQKRGYKRIHKKSVTVPETVSRTVPETTSETVSETVCQINSNSNNYSNSIERENVKRERIENETQTVFEKPESQPKPKRKTSIDFSIPKPPDVTDQTWNDFVQLRKAKKAPVTETCIQGFRREAEKADITLEAALSVTVLHGWQGFKADWLRNKKRPQSSGYDSEKAAQEFNDIVKRNGGSVIADPSIFFGNEEHLLNPWSKKNNAKD